MPRISVIVPCFNQANYIEEALGSVIQQTFSDWECIVVDDGSTDESAALINALASTEPRIRYFKQDNSGPSVARNHGLDLARGDYIQFLDGDDLLMPRKLEKQLSLAKSMGKPSVVISDYQFMDESGNHYERPICHPRFILEKPIYDLAQDWETTFSIPIHSFLFHSRYFKELGIRFDTALPNHEDWDCWMRIFSSNPTIGILQEQLAIYRKLQNSNSQGQYRNWLGFKKAISNQLALARADDSLQDILRYKSRHVDYSYRRTWKGRVGLLFRRNSWIRRNIPWPLQQIAQALTTPPRPPFITTR